MIYYRHDHETIIITVITAGATELLQIEHLVLPNQGLLDIRGGSNTDLSYALQDDKRHMCLFVFFVCEYLFIKLYC